MKPTYRKSDVGCYLDGVRGIHIYEAIIAFAESHGAKLPHKDCECSGDSWSVDCEWVHEVADDATDFMNEHFEVEGACWGFNDGDWGLWESEDE